MTVAPETPLDVLFTPRLLGPTEYGFELPDGWQQGRGLFGGLVAGVLIRALETAIGPGRTLRSLTAELCGPTLPGPFSVRVEMLREGNAVSTMAARLIQNNEVQAHAVGVFGKPRADTREVIDLPAPTIPDWRSIDPVDLGPPLAPDFIRYFEMRPVDGLPFSGGSRATTSNFVRPKYSGPTRDAAWVAACADATWPALFVTDDRLHPCATIAYTLQLILPVSELDPAAPLFYRATDVSIRQGYAVEFRELWSPDGRLVALNQQTIVIIK
jgi:acyl-CoA thioesterase